MAANFQGSSQRGAPGGGHGARWLAALARQGNLALAALVIAVIALLVLPLPTPLLDALIATNLAASIALLMLSVYIPSALGLSTFPSLLLLTTLFRLSLNIASTKLILLEANAGHIIETFGRMVVGGNVVVGIVVFLIIAIVQFIVIAKGAERVAEVGARFSLDGMPGKQMSIDADLRAGIIGKDEAQRRRREIEAESQLHGAMDGAMKFVKGDAIAGLIIAFVNIVAGVAIGVSLHSMTLGAAVDTYSVLSIGDGMVAQIPSLFVSIAAGIVITRVDGHASSRTHLGIQIARQVLGYPNALLMSAAIVATFLFVPGLPLWPFLILALTLGTAGYLARTDRGGAKLGQQGIAAPMPGEEAQPTAPQDEAISPLAVPLRLRLAPDLRTRLSHGRFDAALQQQKASLTLDLGLPFPHFEVQLDASLATGHYAIDVQEVRVLEGALNADNVIPLASHVDATHEAPAESLLAAQVVRAVRRHADSFVGMQEVHSLFARAAAQLPDLTAELHRSVPLQRITDVLRRLAQEGVSIRYLREISESLISWSPREKDIIMLSEYVRVDIGRFIVPPYLDSKGSLRAVVLDADAERAMRSAIHQGAGSSFVALAPDSVQALIDGASRVLAPCLPEGPPVLLAPMDVRRYLKKLLEARFPNLVVLSYEELPAHVQVQPLGRLSMQSAAQRRSA
jgi:type III secretion protein V